MYKPHLKLREKLILLETAAYTKNVSAACEYMGVSRKTYYQTKKAYDEGGVEALSPKLRQVPNLKNRVPEHVEEAVLKLSHEKSVLRQKEDQPDIEGAGFPDITEHIEIPFTIRFKDAKNLVKVALIHLK